jgi:hypothetical protein
MIPQPVDQQRGFGGENKGTKQAMSEAPEARKNVAQLTIAGSGGWSIPSGVSLIVIHYFTVYPPREAVPSCAKTASKLCLTPQ